MTETSWAVLGRRNPKELSDARLQLHWAAQIVPALADAALARAKDDSHSNMQWEPALEAMVGRELGKGGGSCRIGIRLGDATAIAVSDGSVAAELPLAGNTLDRVLAWAVGQVADRTGRQLEASLRSYEMQAHPVSTGKPFSAATDDHVELARWFANGALVIAGFRDKYEGASEIACWPHHFDLASLKVFGDDPDPKTGRSISVGLSPGDADYEQPYFYVSHWPRVGGEVTRLGLPHGEWTAFGAGLRGSVVTKVEDGERQRALVKDFVEGAVRASRVMIGA